MTTIHGQRRRLAGGAATRAVDLDPTNLAARSILARAFWIGKGLLDEGNKLESDFESAGRKRVMDSFVSLG